MLLKGLSGMADITLKAASAVIGFKKEKPVDKTLYRCGAR